jgi:DNA-binding NarL/FixJ family response regulator
MSAAVRILLVDDHQLFSHGLATLLNLDERLEVVGRAQNGREALEQVDQLRPDVVLMDLEMPVVDGVEATRAIVADYPETKVLVLTGDDGMVGVSAALRAGASGVVRKTQDAMELIDVLIATASLGISRRASSQ